MFPAEGLTRPSCFISCTVNKSPFCYVFSTLFFTLLCILLVISQFKMALNCNAELLSSVPTHKKAVIFLMKKEKHVLDELH